VVEGPTNPRRQRQGIPDPDCPGIKVKAEGDKVFMLIPSPRLLEKLTGAVSAIPGYVMSLVASDSPDPYDPFYAFCSQQNIPAITPGRMKEDSQSPSLAQ